MENVADDEDKYFLAQTAFTSPPKDKGRKANKAILQDLSLEEKQLLAARREDGHLSHRFLVLLLAQDFVEEGEEFLFYEYPSDSLEAARLVEMRGLFSVLKGAAASACGQAVRVALFEHSKQSETSAKCESGFESDPFDFKACSAVLGAWAHGLTMAVVHWAPPSKSNVSSATSSCPSPPPQPLLSDSAFSSLVSSLVQLLKFSLGPLPTQIFEPSPTFVGEDSLPGDEQDLRHPRFLRCFHAFKQLDPVFQRCADSLFRAEEPHVFPLALGACSQWFKGLPATKEKLDDALRNFVSHMTQLNSEHRTGDGEAIRVGACVFYSSRVVSCQGMIGPRELHQIALFLSMHHALDSRHDGSPQRLSVHVVYVGSDEASEISGESIKCLQARRLAVLRIREACLCVLLPLMLQPNHPNHHVADVDEGKVGDAEAKPLQGELSAQEQALMQRWLRALEKNGLLQAILEKMKRTRNEARGALESQIDATSMKKIDADEERQGESNGRRGSRPFLLCFARHEAEEGVFVQSLLPDPLVYALSFDGFRSKQPFLEAAVKRCFVRSCVTIRSTLKAFQKVSNRSLHRGDPKLISAGIKQLKAETGGIDRQFDQMGFNKFRRHGPLEAVDYVAEYGLRFELPTELGRQVRSRSTLPPLAFWVVGRLYENGNEVFICYKEDCPPEELEDLFLQVVI